MPLYEYQCEACTHRFEQIRRFSDPPLTSCPRCSGSVRKLVSSPAIQFKGTGWYVTDYAKQDKKDRSDATDSKAGAPSDGAASKSDKQDAKASGDSSKSSASTADSSKSAKPASAGAVSSS